MIGPVPVKPSAVRAVGRAHGVQSGSPTANHYLAGEPFNLLAGIIPN